MINSVTQEFFSQKNFEYPAQSALTTLKMNKEANSRLSRMNVQISPMTGTLNIFNSTKEDLFFFAEIIDNDDYTYDPTLKMTSFYY